MRKTIAGLLVATAGPVAALVGDRLMNDAPAWLWASAAAFCVLAGLVLILLADPVHRRLSPLRKRFPVVLNLVVFVVCGTLGLVAFRVVYSKEDHRPVSAQAVDLNRIILPPQATFLRDAFNALGDELRLASGKQFLNECLLQPGEKLYAREPRELFAATGKARFMIVQSLNTLTAAFSWFETSLYEPAPPPIGGMTVKRGYDQVAMEYHSLLSRRWALVAEKLKDGPFDANDTFRFCVYGLREIDPTALNGIRSQLDLAENQIRSEIREGLSRPRVPAFRIDLLHEKFARAGLPFDGLSSPQAKPTPENDASPAEYFLLENGQYLRATLPRGVTISPEQRTQALDIVKAHEQALRPSIVRRALRRLGLVE